VVGSGKSKIMAYRPPVHVHVAFLISFFVFVFCRLNASEIIPSSLICSSHYVSFFFLFPSVRGTPPTKGFSRLNFHRERNEGIGQPNRTSLRRSCKASFDENRTVSRNRNVTDILTCHKHVCGTHTRVAERELDA
jgi:hypothetical protein